MEKYIKVFILLILILIISVIYSFKFLNFDHKLQGKINKLLLKHSNNYCILDCSNIKWAKKLRNSYKKIYQKNLNFINKFHEPALHSEQVGKVSSDIDKNKKWKSIILYAFNKKTEYSKYFPYTMSLLKKTPSTLAMFSIMEPGAVLTPHHGVYSGVLRYHLALKTPKENNKCCINILDKEDNIIKRSWKEGEDIYFDDMYTHWVENNTNEHRIILFVDIKKKFNNFFINIINNIVLFTIKYNYNKDFELNRDIVKINNILNNGIKNNIFPYFIEDVVPNKKEIENFKKFYKNNYIDTELQNYNFWLNYYTFIHRQDVYSMSSKSDIRLIEEIIHLIKKNNIKGDVVEIGSWRGGMCMYIRHLLKNTNKKIYLYNTFNNFPKSENENFNDKIFNFYKNSYLSINQIKNTFKKLGLFHNVKIIDGDIKETIPNNDIDKISLLRLDCDLYEPILLSLQYLYPKITKGGIILIDDYRNNMVKCKIAVDHFRKINNISSKIINEKNGDSIYWIKK